LINYNQLEYCASSISKYNESLKHSKKLTEKILEHLSKKNKIKSDDVGSCIQTVDTPEVEFTLNPLKSDSVIDLRKNEKSDDIVSVSDCFLDVPNEFFTSKQFPGNDIGFGNEAALILTSDFKKRKSKRMPYLPE